jgi:hypothetical protein
MQLAGHAIGPYRPAGGSQSHPVSIVRQVKGAVDGGLPG